MLLLSLIIIKQVRVATMQGAEDNVFAHQLC
jgi:hypothetical protein